MHVMKHLGHRAYVVNALSVLKPGSTTTRHTDRKTTVRLLANATLEARGRGWRTYRMSETATLTVGIGL